MTRTDIVQALVPADPVDACDVSDWRSARSTLLRDKVFAEIESAPPTVDLAMTRPPRQRRATSVVVAAAGIAAVVIGVGVVVSLDRSTDQTVETTASTDLTEFPVVTFGSSDGSAVSAQLGEAPTLTESEQNAVAAQVAELAAANSETILGTYVDSGWFVVVAAQGQVGVVSDLVSPVEGPLAVSECATSRSGVQQTLSAVEAAGPILGGGYTFGFQPATCHVVVSISESVAGNSETAFAAALDGQTSVPVRIEVAPGEYVTFGAGNS
jgi:hypothetical protein